EDDDIHAMRSNCMLMRIPHRYRQATQQNQRTSQPIGDLTRPPDTRVGGYPFAGTSLFERTCALPATPLSWLSALDRWLCVPAFRRVCPRAATEICPIRAAQTSTASANSRSAHRETAHTWPPGPAIRALSHRVDILSKTYWPVRFPFCQKPRANPPARPSGALGFRPAYPLSSPRESPGSPSVTAT